MSQTASFGSFLRQLRKRMGMTQGDVAAAVGYSISYISSLEADRRLPDLDVVSQQFVPALGLSDEPRLAARLVELAAQARGAVIPPTLTIRRQSHITVDAEAPPTCPIPPTPIIGRDAELQQLCSRMAGHGGRLLTLLGPPGVGKTRLALELALQMQSLYRHGSYFVPLAAITDPQLVATEVANQLALRIQGQKTPLEQIIEFLRTKEVLLVLDNFEQLLIRHATAAHSTHGHATLLVATILAECPNVRILVTSRERLHLRAEQRHRLQPLPVEAAVALFLERAQTMERLDTVGEAEQAALTAICRQLDCLPLAIELAAVRLDLLTPAALLVQLQNHRLDLLTDGAVDLPPHQRTLRRAIQGTYALLTEAEQTAFGALGVFVGHFTAEAAASCGADAAALAGLLHKSLLQETTVGDERRFAMLQTIREFALELLTLAGNGDEVRRHHATYYRGLALMATTPMPTFTKTAWLEHLDRDHDNLRAALTWTIGHNPVEALSFVLALEEFWTTRGYDAEALQWLRAAIGCSPTQSRTRTLGLLALANIARRLGDYATAGDALAEAAILLDQIDEQGEARLKFYRYSGWQYYDLHNYERTVQTFQAGLTLARQYNDRYFTVQFLIALAHSQRDHSEARPQIIAALDEALHLLESLDEPETLAFALQQYGGLEVAAGHYAAAAKHYERMLNIYRQSGNKHGLGWGLALIGESAWFQGDCLAAARYFAEAHRLFTAIENPDGVMIVLHHRGQCARRLGRLAEATNFYQQSLQMAETLKNRHMAARCLAGLGQVALAEGDHKQAARLTQKAKQLFDTLTPFLAAPDQEEFDRLVFQLQ